MRRLQALSALTMAATAAFALPQTQNKPIDPADLVLATVSHPSDSSAELEKLSTLLPKIFDNAISITENSWELGALTQALLEVYDPKLAPFEFDTKGVSGDMNIPWQVIKIANSTLTEYDWSGSPGEEYGWYDKINGNGKRAGTWLGEYLDPSTAWEPLNASKVLKDGDGALGDPCSLGPAVFLLAQLADADPKGEVRKSGIKDAQDYAWAVGNQLEHLKAGKSLPNGTISMREDWENFAVWADMGYMIPPFLAYLGLTADRSDLLSMSLEQYALESSSILDTEHNLYRHIVIQDAESWDGRIWATGNGWMTYGAVRVLASVEAAGKTGDFGDKVGPLNDELFNVFNALFGELDDEGLVPNNMKLTNASETELRSVGDSAGTALIVAAFYRFAVMESKRITQWQRDQAELAFKAVVAKIGEDGWLQQVTDPLKWYVLPEEDAPHSPEGQSFLGMLWAARTAYDAACKEAGIA